MSTNYFIGDNRFFKNRNIDLLKSRTCHWDIKCSFEQRSSDNFKKAFELGGSETLANLIIGKFINFRNFQGFWKTVTTLIFPGFEKSHRQILRSSCRLIVFCILVPPDPPKKLGSIGKSQLDQGKVS